MNQKVTDTIYAAVTMECEKYPSISIPKHSDDFIQYDAVQEI